MADIDIEKDKNKGGNSSKIWLWVIGILILAGIIWWIAAAGDEEEVEEVEEAEVYEQRISQKWEAVPSGKDCLLIDHFSSSYT